ncbi:hypothetical protein ARMA_1784 [Ardenticatena maritima]|uniref:Uncharacterized protein n=1 Tax=Ardenticatena maritima TaxID=872965 RepID=A0A0M8K940_9CHLR|nr:hypothetical protein ARMA_1784 [Ardenticatena maritima]
MIPSIANFGFQKLPLRQNREILEVIYFTNNPHGLLDFLGWAKWKTACALFAHSFQ